MRKKNAKKILYHYQKMLIRRFLVLLYLLGLFGVSIFSSQI